MEERAGERSDVGMGMPLSSVLSPLLRRGERKKSPLQKLCVREQLRDKPTAN